MPESDQWNGDDELPDNGHGDLASETGASIRAALGENNNVLNSDLNEERLTDDTEEPVSKSAAEVSGLDDTEGEEPKPEGEKSGSQGDANKAEQGKTTEERDTKKAEQEAKNADKGDGGNTEESVVTSKSQAKKAK